MDRYDLFSDYAAAKHRIFLNQTEEDLAILNADDPVTAGWAKGLKATVTLFSVRKELEEGLFLRGDELICRAAQKEKILASRSDIKLRGLHNVENILAALPLDWRAGHLRLIKETVRKFKGVEHRMEFVADVNGVGFYNDSKATSVDATLKALEALSDGDGKTVLLLGGKGKNAPYAPLIPLIESTVRTLVVYGEDAENIESQLKDEAEIIRSDSMSDAVRQAFSVAEPGDNVLLAPACASFDMFSSYEERGDVFKKEVGALAAAGAAGNGKN